MSCGLGGKRVKWVDPASRERGSCMLSMNVLIVRASPRFMMAAVISCRPDATPWRGVRSKVAQSERCGVVLRSGYWPSACPAATRCRARAFPVSCDPGAIPSRLPCGSSARRAFSIRHAQARQRGRAASGVAGRRSDGRFRFRRSRAANRPCTWPGHGAASSTHGAGAERRDNDGEVRTRSRAGRQAAGEAVAMSGERPQDGVETPASSASFCVSVHALRAAGSGAIAAEAAPRYAQALIEVNQVAALHRRTCCLRSGRPRCRVPRRRPREAGTFAAEARRAPRRNADRRPASSTAAGSVASPHHQPACSSAGACAADSCASRQDSVLPLRLSVSSLLGSTIGTMPPSRTRRTIGLRRPKALPETPSPDDCFRASPGRGRTWLLWIVLDADRERGSGLAPASARGLREGLAIGGEADDGAELQCGREGPERAHLRPEHECDARRCVGTDACGSPNLHGAEFRMPCGVFFALATHLRRAQPESPAASPRSAATAQLRDASRHRRRGIWLESSALTAASASE